MNKKEVLPFAELVSKARAARQSNQPMVAIENYKKALEQKKNDWDLHYELAVFYGMHSLHNDALKHFKHLYSKFPQNIELNANIGIALYKTDRKIEAIKFLERAFNSNQKFNSLGLILCDAYQISKNNEKALNIVRTMLNRNKRDDKAFYAMASIYQEMKDLPRALECLNNACGLNPDNENYRLAFSKALLDQGFLEQAESEIKKHLIKYPNSIDGLETLCKIYENNKSLNEAIDVLSKLEKIDESNIEYKVNKGYLLLDNRNFHEAENIFISILKDFPRHRNALIGYCNILEHNEEIKKSINYLENYIKNYPDDILILSIYLKAKNIDIDNPLVKKLQNISNKIIDDNFVLNESLAKIMERSGEWDKAFKYYKKSKDIRFKMLKEKYDPKKMEEDIDCLIETFNFDTIEAISRFSKDCKTPIFIFGLPRSGKSVLGKLLSCHKNIIHYGEIKYWKDAYSNLFIEHKEEYPFVIRKLTKNNADQIVDGYLDILKNKDIKVSEKNIIDTLPYNFLNFGLIGSLMPNATFIHCQRNVFDTCLQIYFKNFKQGHSYTYDLDSIIHYFHQYKRIMNHWESILPNKIHHIKFEDIIENPRKNVFDIFSAMSLNHDSDMINIQLLDQLVDEIRGYQSSVGYWRNYEKHLQVLFDNFPDEFSGRLCQ